MKIEVVWHIEQKWEKDRSHSGKLQDLILIKVVIFFFFFLRKDLCCFFWVLDADAE